MSKASHTIDLIRSVVQDNTTVAGRLFDTIIIVIIFYSLFVIAWETVPGLSPEMVRLLELSETVVTSIFVAEYGLRIATARNRRKYLFSFYGIVDFLAIAPVFFFFLPIGNEGTRGTGGKNSQDIQSGQTDSIQRRNVPIGPCVARFKGRGGIVRGGNRNTAFPGIRWDLLF